MKHCTTRVTLKNDISFVSRDDTFGDGEPQPSTTGIGGNKWLEDMVLEFIGNTWTGVCHNHLVLRSVGVVRVRIDLDRERAAAGVHGLNGVANQIDKYLFHGAAVCLDHGMGGITQEVGFDVEAGHARRPTVQNRWNYETRGQAG